MFLRHRGAWPMSGERRCSSLEALQVLSSPGTWTSYSKRTMCRSQATQDSPTATTAEALPPIWTEGRAGSADKLKLLVTSRSPSTSRTSLKIHRGSSETSSFACSSCPSSTNWRLASPMQRSDCGICVQTKWTKTSWTRATT